MYTKYFSDLPLITYAKEMAINPLHFNGLDLTGCGFDPTGCINHWTQTAYELGEYMSRDELSRVIYHAQIDVETELQSFIAPKWYVENIQWPKLYRHDLGNSHNPIFKLSYSNLITLGQQKKLRLSNESIVYSDEDNDGYDELATITFNLSEDIEDINKLFLYYPGKLDDNWRIENFNKVSDGEILTITLDSWLLIKPEYINTSPFLKNKALNACNASIYLETIDIVYESVDETLPQVEIYYKPGCNYENTSDLSTTLDVSIINTELSTFKLNNLTSICTNVNDIDYIRVYYLSGLNTNYRIYQQYIETVIYLASARLPNVCVCSCINERIANLQRDLANRTDTEKFTISSKLLSNPFGTKMGEIIAYRNILNYK